MDSSDRINRTGRSHEGSKHFHVPFIQPQNQSAMLLSLHHNGYSSTFPGHASTAAAQQVTCFVDCNTFAFILLHLLLDAD